jgi:hypothetical protein
MTEIKLKNGDIFEVNKEAYLVSDTLGRPSKFPKDHQFKLFIKHIESHHAGYNIWTDNGIISLEKLKNYIDISFWLEECDYKVKLGFSGLPRLMWHDGNVVDTTLLLKLPIDDEEEFNEYLEGDDFPKEVFERMYFSYNDLTMKNVKELQEEINSWENRESILEFRYIKG